MSDTRSGPQIDLDDDERLLHELCNQTHGPSKPVRLLESQAIYWRRDWDALVIGVVIGVLVTLAVQGAW